jgi:CubicO group peptidase (beta-lactamase class C family)
MLRNHGEMDGVRFLSPKMVDMMTTNQIPGIYAAPVEASASASNGGAIRRDGLSSVGTFSWGGAYGSNYQVDPAEGLTIVFMINQLPNASDVPAKFSTLVYQALVSPRAGTVIQR